MFSWFRSDVLKVCCLFFVCVLPRCFSLSHFYLERKEGCLAGETP